MIKNEDLRIGDLVKTNCESSVPKGTVCTVCEICAESAFRINAVGLKTTEDKGGLLGLWLCEDVDGIPLTVEILLANGWKTHAQWPGIYVRQEYGIEVDFDARKKVAFVSIGAETLNKIKYVHEFQHILWALGFDADMKIPDERKLG